MMQQQRTTVVQIGATWWTTEQPDMPETSILSAELAVAVRVAEQCQMDIVSIAHHQADPSSLVSTTVVYLNNGMSMSDIVERMRPEINNKPKSYWMLQGIQEWQGLLDFAVCIRGVYEEWEV